MSLIDVNNAKQIRPPMVVQCGIAARSNANLTFANLSGFLIYDSNTSVSLDTEEWPVRELTDLQGEGFPADGTCEFYDDTLAGSIDGKVGVQTHIGGTGSLSVSSVSEIPALTIYTEGTGTVTANGTEYELRGVNVITVNAASINLTFTSSDADQRVKVFSIVPGINISWDNDTIISVELDLRSDLSIKDSQWVVSEIEIRAYYPDDISEAVSNIADDVPIWYVAGYSGDMCPQRRFYLSERAEMENNIITIKGHDMSHKLGAKRFSSQVINSTTNNGKRALYSRFVSTIQKAGVILQKGHAFPSYSAGGTGSSLVIKEADADKIVQDIMNLAHKGDFWPTFRDAGIPEVFWHKPTPKWDIYEEDCGEIVREADRNVAKITSEDEMGLTSQAVRDNRVQELQRKNVAMYSRYSFSPGGYWWALSVSGGYDVVVAADKIAWTSAITTYQVTTNIFVIGKDGKVKTEKKTESIDQAVIKGKALNVSRDKTAVTPTPTRAGSVLELSPLVYGEVREGNALVYPDYLTLFERSNITGKFKWKGDPRMQPRDVFNFHRLDGTVEQCTIESIVLMHDGGTVAEITYRKGVC